MHEANTTTMYQAALRYIERGWAVIPVHGVRDGRCTCGHFPCGRDNANAGKHPVQTDWQRRPCYGRADAYALWVEEADQHWNIGIRTGAQMFVMDVDPKSNGHESLRDLIAAHGPVPDTWLARTGSGGAHFGFAVPDGIEIRNNARRIAPGIDIRGTGGFIVAAPSVSGIGAYVQLVDTDPAMPPEWLIELIRYQPAEIDHTELVEGLPTWSELELSERTRVQHYAEVVIEREARSYATAPTHGGNDALYRAACKIIEIVQSPWNTLTVDHGIDLLERARRHRIETTTGGQDAREFHATVNSAIARVVGRGRALPPRPAEAVMFDPPGGAPGGNLPAEFWAARSELTHIQRAAYARGRSADLTLYTVLARLAAMRHHDLRFATVLGTGSLNLFVAAVGASGVGKSSGVREVAGLLTTPTYLSDPDSFRDGLPIGTGEGLAEAYMGVRMADTGEVYKAGPDKGQPRLKPVRAQVRHNAFVYVDEGEALTQQSMRQGTTIGPAIRAAWNGETLGQQNARDETTRVLPAGSYALGMVVGFQRSTAQPLLEDATSGTPQRFVWCMATDARVPDEPIEHPGPLAIGDFGPLERHNLPDGLVPTPVTGVMTFPEAVNAELWARNLARVRAEVEDVDLDSHVPLMRCKLAALLALLNGRAESDAEDWELSGVLWDTNVAVRDSLVHYARREAVAEAERRADARVDIAVRTAIETAAAPGNVERVARWIAGKADERLTRGAINRKLPSRDRLFLGAAIDYALSQKWIEAVGEILVPGSAQPPRE